jgi:hypothetical protein
MQKITAHSALLVALVLLSCAFPARSAMADEPAALIVETSGTVTPEVAPFSEVAAGTVLTLAGHAKLVFDDYYSCSEVTVKGGSVEFGAKGFTTSGDAKSSATRVPCKQEIVLNRSGEASTNVMRGSEETGVRIGTRPSFVLVGTQNLTYSAVRFTLNGAEVRTIKLSGPRMKWPLFAPPLTVGESYQLALVPKSEGDPVKTITFKAVEQPRSLLGSSLIVIRVD